jgi:putative ABC transport system permease protein
LPYSAERAVCRHIATERPIASLKALGYGTWAVGAHYLELVMVSVFLGVILGIGVGLAFGSWMTSLYTNYFHFPSEDYGLAPWMVLVAGGVTTLSAVAAPASAIHAVVRLPPARHALPAPASFTRTLADRPGLGQFYYLKCA